MTAVVYANLVARNRARLAAIAEPEPLTLHRATQAALFLAHNAVGVYVDRGQVPPVPATSYFAWAVPSPAATRITSFQGAYTAVSKFVASKATDILFWMARKAHTLWEPEDTLLKITKFFAGLLGQATAGITRAFITAAMVTYLHALKPILSLVGLYNGLRHLIGRSVAASGFYYNDDTRLRDGTQKFINTLPLPVQYAQERTTRSTFAAPFMHWISAFLMQAIAALAWVLNWFQIGSFQSRLAIVGRPMLSIPLAFFFSYTPLWNLLAGMASLQVGLFAFFDIFAGRVLSLDLEYSPFLMADIEPLVLPEVVRSYTAPDQAPNGFILHSALVHPGLVTFINTDIPAAMFNNSLQVGRKGEVLVSPNVRNTMSLGFDDGAFWRWLGRNLEPHKSLGKLVLFRLMEAMIRQPLGPQGVLVLPLPGVQTAATVAVYKELEDYAKRQSTWPLIETPAPIPYLPSPLAMASRRLRAYAESIQQEGLISEILFCLELHTTYLLRQRRFHATLLNDEKRDVMGFVFGQDRLNHLKLDLVKRDDRLEDEKYRTSIRCILRTRPLPREAPLVLRLLHMEWAAGQASENRPLLLAVFWLYWRDLADIFGWVLIGPEDLFANYHLDLDALRKLLVPEPVELSSSLYLPRCSANAQ